MGNAQPASFEERLRRAIDDAGLTQAEAAKRVGVHRMQISDWVRGKRQPALPQLVKLASGLDVDLNWLLLGTKRPAAAEVAQEVVDRLAALAPDLVEVVELASEHSD